MATSENGNVLSSVAQSQAALAQSQAALAQVVATQSQATSGHGNVLSSLAQALDTQATLARLAEKHSETATAQALWIQQNQCFIKHEQMFC